MNKLRIFCDLALPESALKLLQQGVAPHVLVHPATLAGSVLAEAGLDPALETAEVAFGQPSVAGVAAASRLRWFQLASAGYTRFDTPAFRAAARQRGLILTNSSAVYAAPCAEHVFAFMLAQARQLVPALGKQCASGSAEWDALRGGCRSLAGQKLLVAGYGAIAVRLLELVRPFGMVVTAWRRHIRGNEAAPIVTLAELPAALGQADHVVNILPDNADSRGFFAAKYFALMKPGAVFYNIGRGTTVDQSALVAALQSQHLAAAWLDVTDPEPLPAGNALLSAPNCHITPHIAGGQYHEAESLVRHFLANLKRFQEGAPLADRIL